MTAQRTAAISLWDATAEEPDYAQPMTADLATDVAVVGAGFTGLSTALHCAERDLACHVLEARHIGFGGSGRNCGLVNAALWLPPQDVRSRLGETFGPRFIAQFSRGPETVFSLIEKHQMRCEATKTGTIHAAHSPKGYRDLARRAEEWRRLGEPVELLNKERAAELTGTDAFYGGLLDHRAGTINPMGYARGLARAALGAGAKISTNVTVKKLTRDGNTWLLETNRGVISAKSVVLGTNAYTDDLWPGLRRVFTVIHYFQLASEPLGADADYILPNREGLWDTSPIMFNFRRDAFGRLLIGSMGTIIGGADKGLSRRWAEKRIRRLFPQLGPVRFEEAWHGQIAMTPDHLPRVYRLAENLYTPIGYNGRGITTGTLFGQAMAGLLTGMKPADLPLPISAPATVRSAPLLSRLYQAAFTANQALKSI